MACNERTPGADEVEIGATVGVEHLCARAARDEKRPPMAVGIECRGESYGLLIDTVGEVLKLDDAAREANPVNLDARLARISAGVHRLDGQLLVILDVDRVLDMGHEAMAA